MSRERREEDGEVNYKLKELSRTRGETVVATLNRLSRRSCLASTKQSPSSIGFDLALFSRPTKPCCDIRG